LSCVTGRELLAKQVTVGFSRRFNSMELLVG